MKNTSGHMGKMKCIVILVEDHQSNRCIKYTPFLLSLGTERSVFTESVCIFV